MVERSVRLRAIGFEADLVRIALSVASPDDSSRTIAVSIIEALRGAAGTDVERFQALGFTEETSQWLAQMKCADPEGAWTHEDVALDYICIQLPEQDPTQKLREILFAVYGLDS